MPEYLSPGVYVEEFDSGAVPMEGVGTSTAGFVGLAEKGPVGGIPQLVTGVADFRRTYGGYLSENEFHEHRFLAYAVEHFFINGGTRAYISRVTPKGATEAESDPCGPLTMYAANPGSWGNDLKAVIKPSYKAKTQVIEVISPTQIRVKNGAGFNAGDVIVFVEDKKTDDKKTDDKKPDDKKTNDNKNDDEKSDVTITVAATTAATATAATITVAATTVAATTTAATTVAATTTAATTTAATTTAATTVAATTTAATTAAATTSAATTAVAKTGGKKTDEKVKTYNYVVKSQNGILDLKNGVSNEIVDKANPPKKTLYTCEFSLELTYGDLTETYTNLSLNINLPEYIEKKLARSALVTIKLGGIKDPTIAPYLILADKTHEDAESFTVSFEKGTNGSYTAVNADTFIGNEDGGPGKRTGIQSFIDNSNVSIMAVPGVTDANVQLALVSHCERLASRFAVLDMPLEITKSDDLLIHREMFDTQYAALYHPWLRVFDSLDKRDIYIPPSGSVIGIYARSDATRGVHKAPANEVVRNCTGLSVSYNKAEHDGVNPRGVNLIRAIPGSGINVWGARTASSNGLWKYVNVRRLFIYVEETIKANTNWVVFEPNDETLWARVDRTITSFLTTLWRNGALQGTAASEAFYVQIGRETMSQDDIDSGRLICVIGIAPVKPAEFVIFRLTQKTASE